jgi:hypothetical protein
MYTSIKFVFLSMLLASTPLLPQKLENHSMTDTQFNASQQLIVAKAPKRKKQKEPCSSSPTPGCSRRERVTDT